MKETPIRDLKLGVIVFVAWQFLLKCVLHVGKIMHRYLDTKLAATTDFCTENRPKFKKT